MDPPTTRSQSDDVKSESSGESVQGSPRQQPHQVKLLSKKKFKSFTKLSHSSSSNSSGDSQDSANGKNVYFYENVREKPGETFAQKVGGRFSKSESTGKLFSPNESGVPYKPVLRTSKYFDCQSTRSSAAYFTPVESPPDFKIYVENESTANSPVEATVTTELGISTAEGTVNKPIPDRSSTDDRHMSVCSRFSGVRSLSTFSYSSLGSLELLRQGNPIVRFLKPYVEWILSKIEDPRSYGG